MPEVAKKSIDLMAMAEWHAPTMSFVTEENFTEFDKWLADQDEVVLDVESTGLDLRGEDDVFGIGIGTRDRQWWITNPRQLEDSKIPSFDADLFKTFIATLEQTPRIVAFNLKFDMAGMLMKMDYKPPREQLWIDIMPLARMVMFEKYVDMSAIGIACRFVNPNLVQYDHAFKKLIRVSNKKMRYDIAGNYNLGVYCMGDVYAEAVMYDAVLAKIRAWELDGSTGKYNLLEHQIKLTKTLMLAENQGMQVDREYCQRSIEHIDERLAELQALVDAYSEEPVEITKAASLKKLFHHLNIVSTVHSAKTREESWGKEALDVINHPVAPMVREYRSLDKLKTTYFLPYLHNESGILHPQFKNWGTITGRLACGAPNVQNLGKAVIPWLGFDMPDEDDETSIFKYNEKATKSAIFDETKHVSARRAFIPMDGYTLVGFDYQQIEMRIFFMYLGDKAILEQLEDPEWDAHSWVAKRVWGVSEEDEETFDYYRGLAKAINFGLIYGIGVAKLAKSIGCSEEDAATFKAEYFQSLPKVKELQEKLAARLRSVGYVHNYFGRRYSVPIDAAYRLINYITQGTAGEFVCQRMNALDEFLADKKTKMISQVHDEIVFQVHNSELGLLPDLKRIMEYREIKNVNLPVDMNFYNPSFIQKAKITIEEAVQMAA